MKEAKDYILDVFTEDGLEAVPWLEGWICGYTDKNHGIKYENMQEELIAYLVALKNNA